MTTAPAVSVLIASYNAEAFLAETLDSVLAQTYRPLQIVVVDDGSTDDTSAIARLYAEANPELISVLCQENAGACAARNSALQEATSDYIQFLDADDLLHPEKIERQIVRLADEPAGTVATGPWVRFRGALTDADHSRTAPDWQDYDPAWRWLVQSWSGRGTIPTHSWLVPRDVVERAGPWNEALRLNQDGEFFARVVLESSRIAFVEGAWAYYRSGLDESTSRQRSNTALRSLFESYQLCDHHLLSRHDTPETRRAVSGLWQQFLFTAYPRVRDLCRSAEARAIELGGIYRKPGVIRPLRPIRDLLGWKVALRINRLYHHMRYGMRRADANKS